MADGSARAERQQDSRRTRAWIGLAAVAAIALTAGCAARGTSSSPTSKGPTFEVPTFTVSTVSLPKMPSTTFTLPGYSSSTTKKKLPTIG